MSTHTYLCFDYGTKKIGVAVAQSVTKIASAIAIIHCLQNKPNWYAISQLIEQWQPDELVVGIPVHMDDTEHNMSAKAKRFSRQLEGRFHLPVQGVDERLSSQTARQLSKHQDIDDIAAQVILQSWLNTHAH